MSLITLSLGRCEYATTLAMQEELVARKLAGDANDYLLMLEHEPVYTLGRGADAADLLGAGERLRVAVYRVGRGGGVTFHGHGQMVAYPIVTLPKAGRDVHRYVRALEDVLMAVCADFGVTARRQDGNTGVWVGERKIASIGVGVRRWTTYHGVALNVATDLSFFAAIVPCRMPEARMTSLRRELGCEPSMVEVEAAFERRFRLAFHFEAETADVTTTMIGKAAVGV